MPISSNAPFNEFGMSMVLRDIEQLWLSLNAPDTDANSTTGNISSGPGEGQTQNDNNGVSQSSGETPEVTGGGGAAEGNILLTVDSANTTNAASLVLTGTFYGQSWTFYEKRPRFNAKWVNSVEITTSGSACSVIGRSASTTGAVADIVASDGTILCRSQGTSTVAFSNNPVVVRDSQNLSVCMIASFTTDTTAPTRAATKGELYCIY
jgi:hypothetical protein